MKSKYFWHEPDNAISFYTRKFDFSFFVAIIASHEDCRRRRRLSLFFCQKALRLAAVAVVSEQSSRASIFCNLRNFPPSAHSLIPCQFVQEQKVLIAYIGEHTRESLLRLCMVQI